MIRWFRTLDPIDKQAGFVGCVLVAAFVLFAIASAVAGHFAPLITVGFVVGVVAFIGGLYWVAGRLFPRDPS